MPRRLAPLAVVTLLFGCGGSHAARPTISIAARTAFVDAPPGVVVRGLAAHEPLVVRAETRDLGKQLFRGRVAVRADAAGVAQVPMAPLLSSMYPPRNTIGFYDTVPWAGEVVTISTGGVSARFRLLTRAPNVTERDLRPAADGFYGDFFAAPSRAPRPAVLLFGGSEGGVSVVEEAALLASRGYPTLALAYFGEPGLPSTLSKVPIEYFATALRWLGRQSGVDGHRLIVDGLSRGSEAALLTAVYFPGLVHAVVAMVPGNVVLCAYPGCGGPAWTLHGKAIPYQDSFGPAGAHPIPVERFPRRMLLVCGGGDLIWPSCPMAEAISARRHGLPTRVLSYPDAGHGIADPLPNVPQRDLQLEGFEQDANADARRAIWPKLLRFLAG